MKTNIIAEIGINMNGDIEITKKLIDAAVIAGCDYVKFQKRSIPGNIPKEQLSVIRDTPWGKITYEEYRNKMEFDISEYLKIDRYCATHKIKWFASVWDEESAHFMKHHFPKNKIVKVASALITNHSLLKYCRANFETFMLSTGMSTEEEITDAINIGQPDIIFHTNSAYPAPIEELNLAYIKRLIEKYPGKQIGYSGHEFALTPTIAAMVLGATWIERHITLNRSMWGSDQMASVEPQGFTKLVKSIRDIEISMGKDEPRFVTPSEISKRKSLRGDI